MDKPQTRRRRFSYANVIASLALFFALGGSALAAKHYLVSSTKQIKPSVLAQLRGRSGTPGTPGGSGPTGASGPTGNTGGANPDADAVDDWTLGKIRIFIAPSSAGFTSIYSADGLSLLLACATNGDLSFDFQSAYTNANLQASGQMDGTLFQYSTPGTTGTGNDALVTAGSHEGHINIDYANTVGQNVSVSIALVSGGPLNTGTDCGAWGLGSSSA